MDDRRFDRFARTFATSSVGRRGILAAFVGAAVWSQARNADSAQPACAGDGGYCGMWQGCCEGTVCYVTATNPNSGTCRPGTDVNGTGMVMLGPTGQVIAAQPVATATPRPTNIPRATNTPKPTSTPKTRSSLPPSGNWYLTATLSCEGSRALTTITNVGENPLLLMRIASVRKGMVFDTAGDPSIGKIVIAPQQQRTFSSLDLAAGSLSGGNEFFAKSKKEKARITVQKLNGDGTPVSENDGFMEFRAFCSGEPSILVSEPPVGATQTPVPTMTPATATPFTATPTATATATSAASESREDRRRRNRDKRKRRNRKKAGRGTRD